MLRNQYKLGRRIELKLNQPGVGLKEQNGTSQDFRTLTSTTPQAPDIVGDGNGGITGPFESAQNQFHCGQ
eukprot:scaffold127840_cov81-Cyclotella_meneghiniana.AAC.1